MFRKSRSEQTPYRSAAIGEAELVSKGVDSYNSIDHVLGVA